MMTLEEQYRTYIYLYDKRIEWYHQNTKKFDPTRYKFCWDQREMYQEELKKLLREK